MSRFKSSNFNELKTGLLAIDCLKQSLIIV